MKKAYVVLDTGKCFEGRWRGGESRAGEIVFNTSHSGYEEMATDPSYYGQILVATCPMQGNYGADKEVWESRQLWIEGFICLELQESERDKSWLNQLDKSGKGIVTDIDTRVLVLTLREQGTPWGAVVNAETPEEARVVAKKLITAKKSQDLDWAAATTRSEVEYVKGEESGPRVAVLDLGCKENIIRELKKRCSEVAIFPSRTLPAEIRKWEPDGVLLSNGPGNPEDVVQAVETVQDLLSWRPIFGICMGHHILARALGAKTYKLKFGHRGSNHPVKDLVNHKVYVTSQNHGYAVAEKTLPEGVVVTHKNLNDQTVSGIEFAPKKCFSVQFHPECHPGPRDSRSIFDLFVGQLR